MEETIKILATTAEYLEGYQIVENYGLVRVHASFTDWSEKRNDECILKAQNELFEKAVLLGANALIGLQIGASTSSAMSAVIATAVKVVPV